MKKANESQLVKIVNRLYTMREDQSSDLQIRRFDLFGIESVKVTYNREHDLFTVENYQHNQKFVFDNIELASIEIYQALNELKLTF